MTTKRTIRRTTAALVLTTLGVAACGSDDSSSDAGSADTQVETTTAESTDEAATTAPDAPVELEKASLRLDWTWGTFHAPFLYALDNGYYEEEGIDLTINEGQGSGQTMTLVGTGDATFGWGDTGTAALQINNEVPIKVIAVVQRRTPFGVACQGDVPFAEPSDLVGRSVVMVPQESTAQLWPAYLNINGIGEDEVRVVNADWSNKTTLFVSGQADCMAGYPAVDILQAQLIEPSIGEAIWWGDQGIEILSQGLVASESTLADKPELVKGFLRASLRGWAELCADPAIGSDFFIERFPELHQSDQDVEYTVQSMVNECSLTIPVDGTGAVQFGITTDDEWAQMLDLLGQYGGLEPQQAATVYYTNDFMS
jgi:NitT/TauT family transport system substrate-binding protein